MLLAALVIVMLVVALPTVVAKKESKESNGKGPKPAKELEYSIDLIEYSFIFSSVTFTYRIESGDNPAIKQWELFSDLFTDKSIVSASEKFSVNPAIGRLRFIEHYGPGEVRMVTFTLAMNGYSNYSVNVVEIPFNVRSPPYKESGVIEGPGFYARADPSVEWIRAWGYPGDRLDPGGTINRGDTVRMYSNISDVESASSALDVNISYRLQGGSWTTETATYRVDKNYWYIDWLIPIDATPGLYDVKVDVEDPDGGVNSSIETGEFNVVNADPSVAWIKDWDQTDKVRLDPGGVVEKGHSVRMYSPISDVETLSSALDVNISYRPQGGSWTTETASYHLTRDYWYYDWVIPGDATPGLYDIKVEAWDPDGGSVESTETGEFNVM
jgi:hypothetical protein